MTLQFGRHFLSLTLALSPIFATAQDVQSPDLILATSLAALQKIDSGQIDTLWEDASAFVKTKVPKQEFISGIRQSRGQYGHILKRDWAGVIRIEYPTDWTDPPAGMYANADFASRLANGQTIFEKVSLRLEPNGWRMVGYVPRDKQ